MAAANDQQQQRQRSRYGGSDGGAGNRNVGNSSNVDPHVGSRRLLAYGSVSSSTSRAELPGNMTTSGLVLPTPYDCRHRHADYVRTHNDYAARGLNRNPNNDSKRLLSVAAQNPNSIGYYDQFDRLIQHDHVSSTTPPRNRERGQDLPEYIYGLKHRVNHPASSCRWDPRQDKSFLR